MQVVNGSKVMLMASQGLHQGDGPITKSSSVSAASTRKASNAKEAQTQKLDTNISKIRPERWKATGIIALSDSSLKAVPEEVWGCGSSIRVLDVSNNCIEAIPQEIAALKSLQKLILTANDIADGNISWEGLTCVQTLTVLSLSQNRLVTLPSSLGSMTHLRELRIANNRLENLPVEIGLLKHLEILIANNNRITSLPSSIGGCESLNEVDLSSNLLAELPEAFGNLQHLKALSVRNNGLTSLPSAFFIKCSQLITLDLHGTEITNDVLRQVDGWEEFDERRRKKHQKQLDFRVGSSAYRRSTRRRRSSLARSVTLTHAKPPLTRMTWPFTHAAASLTRNATTGATSVVSAIRPIDLSSTFLTNASSFPAMNSSVLTGPGATTFAVIPFAATSFAMILVIASTAPFVAVYAAYPGRSVPRMDDENVTTRPPAPAGMRFAASRHTRNVPRTLTASMASKSSTAVSASDGYLDSRRPAQATTMCGGVPNASSARSNSARTAAGSDTSARTATARGRAAAPRELRSAAKASALAELEA
uniref:Disease resistance R13L4/SHOC-2-like LRR domain-containing protein n=1 Tax=Oryza meridionalis TaxID=40149 RepID=A0A0E0EYK2_9ORYZ